MSINNSFSPLEFRSCAVQHQKLMRRKTKTYKFVIDRLLKLKFFMIDKIFITRSRSITQNDYCQFINVSFISRSCTVYTVHMTSTSMYNVYTPGTNCTRI